MSFVPEFSNFRYIADTTAVTPGGGRRFIALLALEATVLHADTVCRSCPDTDSLSGMPIPAGTLVTGYFETVKLSSGKVLAYLS